MTHSSEQIRTGPAAPATPAAGAAAAQPARLSDMVAPSATLGFGQAFPRETLIKIGVLALLLGALHFRLIDVMVRIWLIDSNWTHGFMIPLFSLYLLYARREELYAAKRTACVWGLILMLLALAAQVVAVFWIRNWWLAEIGMLGVLLGLALYLGGWAVLRLTWLPILFLLFAMPIPDLLYTRIAVPLQNLSAAGSVAILRLRVDIVSVASRLEMRSISGITRYLTVAEACAGIRLLMAFVALGVALAYLDYKPMWQRLVLVLAAVPIAVFCNIIRVTITCWMYYIDKPELGRGFMHTFAGLLMLVPAFGMLWLLAWLLKVPGWIRDNLFVEELAPAKSGNGPEART